MAFCIPGVVMFDCLRDRFVRAALRPRAPKILHRFIRRKDGATAVEFSLLALPFLALTFAIMETALVFFAGQVLETAAADAARLVMTGRAQQQNMTQAAFKQYVCDRANTYGLFDCEVNGQGGGIQVDVQTYSSFANADMSRPVNPDGTLKAPLYQPGGPGDVVVVRFIYQWPIYVPLMGLNLADMGNKRLLVATAAFRNEPYEQ